MPLPIILWRRAGLRYSLLQTHVFTQQAIALQGFAQQTQQILFVKRFTDEIVGAFLDGFDRLFDGAEGRHQDHRDQRIRVLNFAGQGHAIHARHADVGQNHIDRLPVDDVQCFPGTADRQDPTVHLHLNRAL